MLSTVYAYSLQLLFCILSEDVDSNNNRHAEFLHVLDMLLQIYKALLDCLHVRRGQLSFRHTAMHFQRTHGSYDNCGIRLEACITAFDIEEFFCAEVSTKACLGNCIISNAHSSSGCHDAVAAMSDVSERAAMDNSRNIFQRLYQVRLDSVLQESCHSAVCLNLACGNRLAAVVIGNNDFSQTLLEVMQVACQTENCHNLGSNGDVEAILTRYAMSLAAQTDNDVAQLTIIHIDNAFPNNAARVNVEHVALLDVVVEHCGKQHMRRGNRMEVTGKVQVDVLHRHNLRIAAAGSAALDAHAGAEGRLTQCHDNTLAELMHALCQTNGRGGLAFTGRSRSNRGYKNQLARLLLLYTTDQVIGKLGLVLAV